MTFPATELPLTVEMLKTGDTTWTDITSKVRGGDPDQQTITVHRGRRDETTTVDPSNITMTLDNRTGDFCPTNPSGAYYGKIGRGTPVHGYLPGTGAGLQVPIRDGSVLVNPSPQYQQWFASDSAAGTPLEAYASCPDSVGLSITGDLELQVEADLADWTQPSHLVAKYNTTGNQRSYRLSIGAISPDRIGLVWSTDGTSAGAVAVQATQPLPHPLSGRKAVAASLQVNVSGSYNVKFWYATSLAAGDSGGWVQLGNTVTGAATSVYDSTAIVQVGRWCTGTIYEARVYSGVHTGSHTLKANPIWSGQSDGSTSLTDAQGNVWSCTLAAVVNRNYRFAGEMAAWPIKWDVTGKNIYAPVTAAGVLRRITAATSPVDSAFYTGTLQHSDVFDYWPCEDGSSSTTLVNASGSRPGKFTGAPTLATDSSFACSKPLPTMGTSVFTFPCTTGGNWSAGTVAVRMLLDGKSVTNGAVLMRVWAAGGVARWDLVYSTGGALALNGYDNQGNSLLASGATAFNIDNTPGWVGIELTQSGTTCTGRMVWLPVGVSAGTIFDTAITLAGGVGQPSMVQVNASGNAGSSVGFGHLTTHNANVSIYSLWRQLSAFNGEPAAIRVARICAEHGIGAIVRGAGWSSTAMGVQPVDTVANILSQCQEADGGILYEPRDFVGVGYRCRSDITACAQLDTGGATLTYSAGDLSDIQPTYDDLMTSNLWTATRSNAGTTGSSATAEMTSGPMSTQDPPSGIGERAKSASPNVYLDGLLPDQAWWRLNLGTWDGERYPQIEVKLARSNFSTNSTLTNAVAGLDVGDPLTITGWDLSGYPPNDVEQLAVGYTEVMSNVQWDVTFNCIPAGPWQVAIHGDGISRYDTEASTLHADITSTATSMTVDTTSGPRWVTSAEDAGAFPFDIRIGGERITVGSITGTSNPQTFGSLTRHVNGVTKSHTAGDSVSLWRPSRYGMRS